MTEQKFKHESYCLVQLSRRQGSPKLFASRLSQTLTQNYVCLSVRRAELIRDDSGMEHYYGSMRGDLIEVNLSAAQFAEMLTTMNIGMGVPGTLAYLQGERMQDPPDVSSEAESIRENFNKNVGDFSNKISKDTLPKIREVLAKKTLNKEDRRLIEKAFEEVVREVGANVPYAIDLFQEATEKVVSAAKTEIDAFFTTTAMQAGVAALQSGNVAAPALPGKSEE